MNIVNKRITLNIVLISLAASMLSGCNGGAMKKEGVGVVVGGLAGGLLGAQFGKGSGKILGAGIGAIAGAAVGSAIGRNMDETDKLMMERTSQKALEYSPTGRESEWRNPDNGHYGTITPKATYRKDGNYCREYTQTVVIGGNTETAYGKACRKPDGQWEIVG